MKTPIMKPDSNLHHTSENAFKPADMKCNNMCVSIET